MNILITCMQYWW